MSSSSSSSSSSIQQIIEQSRKTNINHLRNNQPFTDNYKPYSQNQLRDLHYNRDCALQWNTFYRNNGRKAYKDRHYILKEFTEMKETLDALIMNKESCESLSSMPQRRTRENDDDDDDDTTTTTSVTTTVKSTTSSSPTTLKKTLLLDFGCGVGNLCLPILEEYRNEIAVVASDLAQVAVASLQNELNERTMNHQAYTEASDLGSDHETRVVPNLCLKGIKHIFSGSANNTISSTTPIFSSLVFVLCSVPRNLWNNVVLNIVNSLKDCSNQLANNTNNHDDDSNIISSSRKRYLFFRDYCKDDLAMHRFSSHRAVHEKQEEEDLEKGSKTLNNEDSAEINSKNNNNNNSKSSSSSKSSTYMRTNGTLSHFFTLQEIEELFSPYFDILDLRVITLAAPIRDVVSIDFQMNERKFVQAKFLLK